jgi:hypothetical protein
MQDTKTSKNSPKLEIQYSENLIEGLDYEKQHFAKAKVTKSKPNELLGIRKEGSQRAIKPSPNRHQFVNYTLKTKTGFKTERTQKYHTNETDGAG